MCNQVHLEPIWATDPEDLTQMLLDGGLLRQLQSSVLMRRLRLSSGWILTNWLFISLPRRTTVYSETRLTEVHDGAGDGIYRM